MEKKRTALKTKDEVIAFIKNSKKPFLTTMKIIKNNRKTNTGKYYI